MNKSDLIESVRDETDMTHAAAERTVNALLRAIRSSLEHGDNVTLPGFGTFEVRARAARTGTNPATGDKIDIPAHRTVGFKAGKGLKEAVK